MSKVKELQDREYRSSWGKINLTSEEAGHYLSNEGNDIEKALKTLEFDLQAADNRDSTVNRASAKRASAKSESAKRASAKSERKSKKSKRSSREKRGCFSCCGGRAKTAVSQEFTPVCGGGNKKRIKTKKISQKTKRKIQKRIKRNNRSRR